MSINKSFYKSFKAAVEADIAKNPTVFEIATSGELGRSVTLSEMLASVHGLASAIKATKNDIV